MQFSERIVLNRRAELVFKDEITFCKSFVGITVVLFVRRSNIAGCMGVQLRGVFLQCLTQLKNRRQQFIFDFD